jgi:hypothetical protein|tara:strand:- start:1380 stop:1625 length:246 start_codon:yes stop_codon:yes gene_type:complete
MAAGDLYKKGYTPKGGKRIRGQNIGDNITVSLKNSITGKNIVNTVSSNDVKGSLTKTKKIKKKKDEPGKLSREFVKRLGGG